MTLFSNTKTESKTKPSCKTISWVNRVFQSRKLQMFAVSGITASVLLISSQLPFISSAQAGVTSLNAEQQQDVRTIIKDALINDPDLLKEAIIALQTREQQGANSAKQNALEVNHTAMYDTKSDPWKGAEKPEITMVYFTDFNCPYCKKIEPSLNQLIEEFPQLKIIVKMVPLQGAGSKMAVELAQMVWLNEPEKFIKLKDMLMSSPRRLDAESITKVAKLTGTEQWLGKADTGVDEMVHNNIQLMRNLGIGGTPSMIFGDKIIAGLVSYDVLKEQLEEMIEAKG
ncbi:DsbA family protein [Shewanella sp. D64]|uniref:DsbA family protein n=1 Tax=unclassified Shewanella TaxID=196818 RepID=UPI0022BA6FBD|nr:MULTISPECIES: DsbA family protein [unclassified Shewanella]MEC4725151.1 DsbA family protein [Shewanella sp. D64]MEC4737052.1 DsbA family protein [Shewanella sp. E94]WBJ96637.1 DsbA family protein [Shewanella sp. MTB7]